MTTTLPQDPTPQPHAGLALILGYNMVNIRAPEAVRKNYCPQAILKLKASNSFDYRVLYSLVDES